MSDYLFHEGDLSNALRGREQELQRAAEAIPPDRALGRSVDELAAALADEHRVDPLVIDWDRMAATVADARVDVSHDWMRGPFDREGPVYVPGTRVTYHIPFRGERDLFKMAPSTSTGSLPSAEIRDGEINVMLTAPAPAGENLKAELSRQVALIRSYAGWVNSDVETFNRTLPDVAHRAAERRRDKVLGDQALAASLGVPLRRREGATPTYAAPAVRRKVVSPPTPRAQTARPPEPVVLPEEYENILDIVRGMALVLERSPKTFAGMDEEAMRDHFLIQLNGQYQGGATGETFNGEGKTDILVRDGNRNVFIAECKVWRGPKGLAAAIDQLLGYASWRDTKTAIFLFNRNRDLSKVLEQVGPTVSAHPNHIRSIPYGGETESRHVLRHRDDADRELTLTVMVFEVPA